MKKLNSIIIFSILIAPALFGEETQLLLDRHFQNGFNVLAPKHGARVVEGKLDWNGGDEPVWDIGQWHSKYSINGATVCGSSPDKRAYINKAKSVIVGKEGTKWEDITLGVNSLPEYEGKLRKDGEPWPHLLVTQGVTDRCPYLSDVKELKYHIDAKLLLTKTMKPDGYTTALHCAQIPCVFIIQNRNIKSPGYGDFIWFLIPIYDDRYDFSPPMTMQDCADPSQKLIYSPGAKAYMDESLKSGEWITIDKDIYPLLIDALEKAWEKGYLKGSQDIKDYKITSVILGWEITGLNKVSMQFKDFSLIAVTRE